MIITNTAIIDYTRILCNRIQFLLLEAKLSVCSRNDFDEMMHRRKNVTRKKRILLSSNKPFLARSMILAAGESLSRNYATRRVVDLKFLFAIK